MDFCGKLVNTKDLESLHVAETPIQLHVTRWLHRVGVFHLEHTCSVITCICIQNLLTGSIHQTKKWICTNLLLASTTVQLIFCTVTELQNSGKSMKSCEIHKSKQNMSKLDRNLAKYISVQHSGNLSWLLGLITCSKLANLP